MSELARAMELVGNKWALHIVESLLGGPRRFTEIERSLGDVNPKLITVRLRELEADGLVSRTAYAEVPPRVEYALTEWGRELRPTIAALRRTHAVNKPASAEQRDKRRACDRERRRRQRNEQADAADDPIPGEERGRDALLFGERERGVMRDEVPHEHEGARDLDERTQI